MAFSKPTGRDVTMAKLRQSLEKSEGQLVIALAGEFWNKVNPKSLRKELRVQLLMEDIKDAVNSMDKVILHIDGADYFLEYQNDQFQLSLATSNHNDADTNTAAAPSASSTKASSPHHVCMPEEWLDPSVDFVELMQNVAKLKLTSDEKKKKKKSVRSLEVNHVGAIYHECPHGHSVFVPDYVEDQAAGVASWCKSHENVIQGEK